MKAFCCLLNGDEVVILLEGGGDTSTLHAITKLDRTFALRSGGVPKT